MTKLITIATALTIILLAACAFALPANAESATFERVGVVTAWATYYDCIEYTVTLEDGTMLAFYADKGDYSIGTMVLLTLWDEIEQEVIDVDYVAYLNPIETAAWMTK